MFKTGTCVISLFNSSELNALIWCRMSNQDLNFLFQCTFQVVILQCICLMCILSSAGNKGFENHHVRLFWLFGFNSVNERKAGNLWWNFPFSKSCYGFDDMCITWMNFDVQYKHTYICMHLFPTSISRKPITHLLQSFIMN